MKYTFTTTRRRLFPLLLWGAATAHTHTQAQAQAKPSVSANPGPDKPMGRFNASLLKKKQDTIRVQGNRFVDESGKTFVFRGVSVADPDKLVKEKQWKLGLFQELKRWGVNTVRLPIHPQAWRERGAAGYVQLIDQAVVWANQLQMYLIIDWHSIGFLASGQYQDPVYATNPQETLRFWRDIAVRYQGIPTTAVYELFNEPTTLKEPWGQAEWDTWKAMNEEMIDAIYAIDKTAIPLVAGFDWAYDLTPVKNSPIDRPGVAYASHPYPQKEQPEPATKENFFKLWQNKWGFVSEKYPMICTEIGWVQPNGFGAHIPVKNDGSYGPHIVEFMEARGISWTAWVFDPLWSPTLINDWNFTPSEQGAFFKKVLQEKAKSR